MANRRLEVLFKIKSHNIFKYLLSNFRLEKLIIYFNKNMIYFKLGFTIIVRINTIIIIFYTFFIILPNTQNTKENYIIK